MSKKSVSIGKIVTPPRSQIGQTQSQQFQLEDKANKNALKSKWYQELCSHKINLLLPSYIPTYNHTQPYKLTIFKVMNLTIPKKSSQSHQFLFIQCYFITDRLQIVGRKVQIQCQEAIVEGKLQIPIPLYYHSTADRNYSHLKMMMNLFVIQLRNNAVEGKYKIGSSLIGQPFMEKEVKNATIYKQCSEIDLISNFSILAPQTSSTFFSYKIQSHLELKMLVKLIPSECIVSCDDHLSGVLEGYLPSSEECVQIIQQNSVYLRISDLQIHIPQKFEKQVIENFKKIPQFSSFSSPTITGKKLTIGFHNQFQFIAPTQRKLQFIELEATGQYRVGVYQFVNENELVKIMHYVDEERESQAASAFVASLIFQINGVEVEVAIFIFEPKTNGQQEQINVSMMTGPGQGIIGNLLNVLTDRKPTIIMQYCSQQLPLTGRSGEQNFRSFSRQRLKSNYKLPLKSSKQVTQMREQQKILEEVEMERIQLQKQKQQLQRIKNYSLASFQEEFMKKLDEQRQQLWLRQNMIEQQYREEVEREIHMKIELQNQIRMMKQKLADMEERQRHEVASKKLSYDESPQIQPQFTNQITGQFLLPQRSKPQPILIEEEKKTNIPLKSPKQHVIQLSSKRQEELQKQYQQFNHASKFTFTFTSTVWSAQIWPPKSFFFLIKFFNFKDFRTDTLTNVEGQNCQPLVKMNHHENSKGQKQPIYHFVADPSRSRNPKVYHEEFINYLIQGFATIEILTQNFLQVGEVQVQLLDTLRCGKGEVLVAKQSPIFRGKQFMGTLQMLIKNQKQACFDIVKAIDSKKPKVDAQKKFVLNHPIELPTNSIPKQNEGISKEKKMMMSRQQKKIEQYKKNKALVKNQFVENKVPPINKINQYKQKKMPELINKIYEEKQ